MSQKAQIKIQCLPKKKLIHFIVMKTSNFTFQYSRITLQRMVVHHSSVVLTRLASKIADLDFNCVYVIVWIQNHKMALASVYFRSEKCDNIWKELYLSLPSLFLKHVLFRLFAKREYSKSDATIAAIFRKNLRFSFVQLLFLRKNIFLFVCRQFQNRQNLA